jgi:fibronectin-binding autotransporter adhesin
MSWRLHGRAQIRLGLRSTGLMLLISTLLVLWLAHAAQAASCTDSWKTAVSGNWDTAGDWSTGAVPTSSDNVCITAVGSAAYTVTVNGSEGSVAVNSLTVGPASGGVASLFMEGQGGEDDLNFAVTGAITTGSLGEIALTNVTGTTTAPQDVNLNWGGAFANAGKLYTVAGTDGGTRELEGNLTNTGVVGIDFATSMNTGSLVFDNKGALSVSGATLSMDGGSQTFTNDTGGSITDALGGNVDLNSSATFNQGTGTAGAVVLENSSTLNLGASGTGHAGTGTGTFTFTFVAT